MAKSVTLGGAGLELHECGIAQVAAGGDAVAVDERVVAVEEDGLPRGHGWDDRILFGLNMGDDAGDGALESPLVMR